MGRSRVFTALTSNLGRLLMTLFKSEPFTLASLRRKVKTGRMSEAREVKISGHMETIRRKSAAAKSMEVIKSTVDLMSFRDAETIGGWSLIKEKKSIPMESRKSIFSWNSEWVIFGGGEMEGICVIFGGMGGEGVGVIVLVESEGKWTWGWRFLGRESEGKSWWAEGKWSFGWENVEQSV